jgi:hypothetical protein
MIGADAVADDDDEPVVPVMVTGRIVTQLGTDGRPVGLDDVTVRIGTVSAKSNASGAFSLTIDPGEYGISFVKDGYGVLIWPGTTFDDDGVRKVVIPGDDTDIGDAAMTEAVGTVYGTVYRNEVGVGGVLVELIDASGKVLKSTRTDGNGDYTLQIATGTYTVAVNILYYSADPFVVTLGVGDMENHNFILESRGGETFLFGFDLTHSLMLIGGLIGSFLLIFVVLYRIHIGRNPESSKIHSDSKKDQN